MCVYIHISQDSASYTAKQLMLAPFTQWLRSTFFFWLLFLTPLHTFPAFRDCGYTNIKYCLNCTAHPIPHCCLNMVSLCAIEWHNCSLPVSSSNSPDRFTCCFWLRVAERVASNPIFASFHQFHQYLGWHESRLREATRLTVPVCWAQHSLLEGQT